MTTPPLLTDRSALDRNRARARRSGPALFLHDDAAAELEERLNEVNRTFTAPAVVTAFPDPWRETLPAARIVADDEVLDLAPGAHDLVVHALALHWANDPVGQIVQAARALRPDGLFIAVMFGGQTLAELRAALAEAEVAVTGGLSPRVLPMGEIRDLGALLQRAGLALPVADSVLRRVSYADPFRLMADLRAMGEANALTGRRRTLTPRAVFAQAARRYAAAYAEPGGRVRASFDMVWLTGWKPHESQQKPLRPGSAAARLADALGAAEQSAGDKAGQ
ncbi:methyltransferase domain-containing protein [Pontitalea aquivivens]|uniref:methyltransferase domain-containing protein n=1 Tax=Pontitalea aquivivens TaxID=3388663 RepID=UPI00397104FF